MARKDIDIEVPDLTGRRVVLTGGSDGIGLGIAKRLAAAGAELVLPVRNQGKGQAAAAEIRVAAPGAHVLLHELDLSSLDSVAQFGQALLSEGMPIHVLINNAGIMTPPDRQTTQDGFELQLGTNHLGHVALVAHLLPVLQAGRARVTSQVSIAAASGAVHWEDLSFERSYSAMKAYRSSKIAFGLFGLELDRRSRAGGWGISSNLSHPGVAPTNLLAARPELGRPDDTRDVRIIRALAARGLLVGTPRTAGLPALLAATAPDAGGQLYGPRGFRNVGGAPAEQALMRPLRSEQEAQRIWDASEAMVGLPLAPAARSASGPSAAG